MQLGQTHADCSAGNVDVVYMACVNMTLSMACDARVFATHTAYLVRFGKVCHSLWLVGDIQYSGVQDIATGN